jgi:hypothetical protein
VVIYNDDLRIDVRKLVMYLKHYGDCLLLLLITNLNFFGSEFRGKKNCAGK